MASGFDWREFMAPGRRSPGPLPTEDDGSLQTTLETALGRHETALARLRLELPSPSALVCRELEAAENALRAVQARRDQLRR
jgi:hypothetical protein